MGRQGRRFEPNAGAVEEATAPLERRSGGSEAECGVGEEEEAPPEDGAENAKPNGGEGGG